MKALWNDQVIAESNECIILEGNCYFPPNAIKKQYFNPSNHHTICSWKGQANYYHIVVDDQINENAAWYYPEPRNAAQQIKNYVAFWKGVQIVE